MMMPTCDACKIRACILSPEERAEKKLPLNCPMHDGDYMKEMKAAYWKPDVNPFYVATKTGRAYPKPKGYAPRLRTVIDFMKRMGYKKIGFAFCVGFHDEAAQYAKILRRFGFEVVSACCCNGGFSIADHGCPLPAGCDFDAACNPLGQAELLNREKVEFNLVMGLCGGHDSLFIKNAEAMSTMITVKDPATGHCPPMALYLYDQYFSDWFIPEEEEPHEVLPIE